MQKKHKKKTKDLSKKTKRIYSQKKRRTPKTKRPTSAAPSFVTFRFFSSPQSFPKAAQPPSSRPGSTWRSVWVTEKHPTPRLPFQEDFFWDFCCTSCWFFVAWFFVGWLFWRVLWLFLLQIWESSRQLCCFTMNQSLVHMTSRFCYLHLPRRL